MNGLVEGLDYYYNEDGWVVLTEHYHLQKGYCCGSGCTHCPYEYANVGEPRRSMLLEQRRKRNLPSKNLNKS